MRVMIAVTHLLGSGHLSRALTLGRAFADAGHKVSVLSGGMPAPHLDSTGVRLVQLPPLRSDGVDFARLLDATGKRADARYLSERTAVLLDELTVAPPDVVITELFPFGRRSLKPEFESLLKTAAQLVPKPLVLSSIRDILAPPSKPSKATYAAAQVAAFYDGVLVHSDPAVTPLDISWPVTPALQSKLTYTGFIAPPAPQLNPDVPGRDEILVSAGGGDVGTDLFNSALEAAKLRPNWVWRILVAGANGSEHAATLRARASENVIVQPATPAFREMLCHAKALVSMCGYNTALDVLQTGVATVFVPFDAGGEVEQSLRANAMAAQNGIAVLRSDTLTAPSLLNALDAALAEPERDVSRLRLDGAQNTVALAVDWRGLL